jgi:hypothetical protein
MLTKRERMTFRPRNIQWARAERLPTVADLLNRVGEQTELVYLTGPRPRTASERADIGFRTWIFGTLPDGWQHGGHYLDDSSSWTLNFVRPNGEPLAVMSWVQWFDGTINDEGPNPHTAARALDLLQTALREQFGNDVTLLPTPATTGRYLLKRSVPPKNPPLVLDDETQRIFRRTSTQGRVQTFVRRPAGAYAYDMHFAYGGLLSRLPVGPVRYDTIDEWPDYQYGRARVEVNVPSDWSHVGLVGLPSDDGIKWEWPDEPNRTFTTWVDGSEIDLLKRHGWRFRVLGRLLLDEGQPLDRWRKRVMAAYRALGTRDQGDQERALAARALRKLVLTTVGALHGSERTVTCRVPRTDARWPKGAIGVRRVGDHIEWRERRPVAWPEMVHPEWSSTIWARCRVRVVDHASAGTGALHVPRSDLIAIRSDALYLANDPQWPAVDRFGYMRSKGYVSEIPGNRR